MIFSTPSRRRRRLLIASVITLLVLIAALATDLLCGLLISPSFSPSLGLVQAMHRKLHGAQAVEPVKPPSEPASHAQAPPAELPPLEPAARREAFRTKPWLRTAFVLTDDQTSLEDFQRRSGQLDAVFPTGLRVETADGNLRAHPDARVIRTLSNGRNLVLPVVSNTSANGDWLPDRLATLLGSPEAGERLIRNLKAAVTDLHADGINLDFEQLSGKETDDFNDWVKRLCDAFHADNLLVTVDLPMNDEAYDPEFLGGVTDAVVAMAYDEHYAAGHPGSIAGQPWFTDALDDLSQRVPAGKLIVALGGYGYDWNVTAGTPPEAIGFEEAMFLASDEEADVEADGDDLNSHFEYTDEDTRQKHEVWFLDAISAWNQTQLARSHGIRGFSLWRMGLEDPGIWDFLGGDPDQYQPARLTSTAGGQSVHFLGEGELLRVRSVPTDGKRNATFDGRLVDWAKYETIPRCYEVDRFGHSPEKKIALTFDDGPDPTWTPKILKVLQTEHVPGAFFVVGDQAQKNPELVKDEFARGHLIGNHTFLHPNIQTLSETHLRMELNATERVIESLTGRAAKLFRAPFDTDTSPTLSSELKPLHVADSMGLVVAGGDIDSDDYDKPGTDVIVDRILQKLTPDGPNVVVMHDGGGDRHQTVEALQRIIPLLKSRGYEFVALNQLMGVSTQDLMPPASTQDGIVDYGQSVFTYLRTKGWIALQALFYFTTVVSMLRIAFLGIFLRRKQEPAEAGGEPFTPPVTVLVPAYNESKVIRRTLDGLLCADYPDLQILVVDDGSTDDTAAQALAFAEKNPRVRVITKPNGGKWSALNQGFREIDRDYIVTIDADTIIPPGTIRSLIAPFRNPEVDAVCGNVQVGNVRNILTAFQDVEYVTTQNYDRRAFDSLNCISVVPGATGAWKRQAVLDAGGYSDETLTEDADLTLTLLKRGAKIVYAPEARSVTEAPETVSALFKQRFRWSYGTFQCLWKHRGCAGKGTLGKVAFPNLFLFQVVYPVLSPLGDAVFFLSLLRGDFGAIALGYGLFLLMDLIGSIVAFQLDHRKMRTLWVVLIQRFYYRQFMYCVTFKSIIRAFCGGRQAWNKLERKDSIRLPSGYGSAR